VADSLNSFEGMNARFPGARSVRWIALPAFACALAGLVMSRRRRASRRPVVPPVSDTWLRNHEYAAGQHADP
jgi:hypothetical protein